MLSRGAGSRCIRSVATLAHCLGHVGPAAVSLVKAETHGALIQGGVREVGEMRVGKALPAQEAREGFDGRKCAR